MSAYFLFDIGLTLGNNHQDARALTQFGILLPPVVQELALVASVPLTDEPWEPKRIRSALSDESIPYTSWIHRHTTSFILAGVSVCQLIFMSELGVIILRSSLPLSVSDLAVIFLLRTAIVLPVVFLRAHLVIG